MVERARRRRAPSEPIPAEVLEETWARQVRANRAQVEGVREVEDGPDFYAPVSSLFRADPRRTDDPVLDALLVHARPDETWLDIGAGGGRYALPLALHVREVIAIDPSPGMLAVLGEGALASGIGNVRTVQGRWPEVAADLALRGPPADVALIAHVGYDIEAIGPFLDAMERAARLCVAVMMERPPASAAYAFWPAVHGQDRAPLPALPELCAVLVARGAAPTLGTVLVENRTWASRDEVLGFLRRQLWVAPDGPKDRLLGARLDANLVVGDAGFVLRAEPRATIGIVTWPARAPWTGEVGSVAGHHSGG